MPLKPCIDCGELSEEARCPEHRASFDRERRRGGKTNRWRKIRERILKRDDYRCQCPGCEKCKNREVVDDNGTVLTPDEPAYHVFAPELPCGRGFPLEVDHVNGDRHDDRPENLRTLCKRCHVEKHRMVRRQTGPHRSV